MKTIFVICLQLLLFSVARSQNGSMENWHTYTSGASALPLEAPADWHGSDSALIAYGSVTHPAGDFRQQIFRSSLSHTGSYAARLMTSRQSWYQQTPFNYIALLSNGRIRPDTNLSPQQEPFFQLEGGSPVNQRIQSVSFWIMQDSLHLDKFRLQVLAVLAQQAVSGRDSVVGDTDVSLYFSQNPGYNQFTLPIPYKNATVVPDHIIVAIYSGSPFVATAPLDSAAIYVDDVILNSASGTGYSLFKSPSGCCVLYGHGSQVTIQAPEGRALILKLYDIGGRQLGTFPFSGNSLIYLGDRPEGSLFYRIFEQQERTLQQGRLIWAE